MKETAPTRLKQAVSLTLALLLLATPAGAGVIVRGTQGLVVSGTDGITYENTSGLTFSGSDGLGLSANGIFERRGDGLTVSGSDGLTVSGVDGVTYTGSNTYTATRADGLTVSGADGLTVSGADGLTVSGADGSMHHVNSLVVRTPNGLTVSGADGLTVSGADGVTGFGSDTVSMVTADGLIVAGTDSLFINSAAQVVGVSADGQQVLTITPDGLTVSGADGLTVSGADGVTIYGPEGLTVSGTDAYEETGLEPVHAPPGLLSVDPELALRLDQASRRVDYATDDSGINAVVVYHNYPTSADLADLERFGVRGGTLYRHLPMVAVTTTVSQLDQIGDLPNVRSLYTNRTLNWSADASRSASGVTRVRADSDLTGQNGGLTVTGAGVRVAVLDTGVDATHGDLAGRVVKNIKLADLQGQNVVGFNHPVNVEGLANTDQASGHGTFVAGLIAANSARTGGKFDGAAPGAQIVGLSAGDATLLSVLAGLDYLVGNHASLNVRVVNCSFSANTVYDSHDPVNVATKILAGRGVNVVFSAGNTGPGLHTLNPYAAAPWVISAGALDQAGRLARFSSRGDFGSRTYRPTLVAPGVNVVSLRATGPSAAEMTVGGVTTGDDAGQLAPAEMPFYVTGTGTSFSAPLVAGTIALMLDANPNLSPAQVRDILQRTATPLPPYYQHEVGAGALNAHAAVLEAAFPDRHIGLFRATLNRRQVRFVKGPAQIFSGTVVPGAATEISVSVPADSVLASADIAWGPMWSTNDLALSMLDPQGVRQPGANAVNLPGLTGRREHGVVNAPAAGTWRLRVTNTLGPAGTEQNFNALFETARFEIAPLPDLSGLDSRTLENIRYALRTCVMSPVGGRFRPAQAVSRADMAAAMLIGGRVPQYLPANPRFNDVNDALTMSFIEGVQAAPGGALFFDAQPGGAFRPDHPTTRLVATVALVRAAGLEAEALANTGALLTYADAGQIPSKWRGYVAVAAARDLIPVSGTFFRPSGAYTRADLAHALKRLSQIFTTGQ